MLDMVQVEGAKHSTTHINLGKSSQAKIDQLNHHILQYKHMYIFKE